MSEQGNIIRTAAGKRAVAKARPPSAPARARPVERSGRMLSQDTISKLQEMMAHINSAKAILQSILDEAQAMLDANESGEKFAELMKQWSHALH
jgi:hypothetical protein